MHRLRFRRWLKAYRFVNDINALGYEWNPIRIRKHKRWYYLEYESMDPRKVTAYFYQHIHYYSSYK